MKKYCLVLCLSAVAAGAATGEVRRIDCVQVNQAGYLPQAFKVCLCENPPRPEFRVQRLDEETEKRCWHDVTSDAISAGWCPRRPVFGQFYPSTPQIPGATCPRL